MSEDAISKKTTGVIDKIDTLLLDNKNFTTRVGLRFMTTVMKDALLVIAEVADRNSKVDDRLKEIDSSLTTFLKSQNEKDKKADDERTRWRWAFITPTIGLVIVELARWLLGR